jgi:hypothetical protein
VLTIERLAEVLRQLFFKQNKYADNNAKYLEKKTTPEPQANEFDMSILDPALRSLDVPPSINKTNALA